MRRTLTCAVLTLVVLSGANRSEAHPAPFSYLDVRVGPEGIDVSLVVHIFDVAHDLRIEPQERLLEPAFLAEQSTAISALLRARLGIAIEGTAIASEPWSPAEALPDRQAVRISARFPLRSAPGVIAIAAEMFPYDAAHQTFVNVYESDALTLQAILGAGRNRLEYFPGSRQGLLAVARRFAPVGVRHILFGLDHLVLLGGLLLLGGPPRRLLLMVCALAGGNALALILTALDILQPPGRLIEPAIALGIVYVGVDNLMVRGGRDTRVGIALVFGLIHGFWFANGLRAIDLPTRTLEWSLLSFGAGIEFAHVLVVAALGSAIMALRSRNAVWGQHVAYAGSLGVVAAGAYWFVQLVFFPAGIV